MSSVILSLFGICLLAGVCEILLPSEANAARRALRTLTALIVLLLILTPFVHFLQNSEGLSFEDLSKEEGVQEDFDEVFKQTLAAQCEQDLEAGVVQLLQAEFGIAPTDCSVDAHLNAEGDIAYIRIRLTGKALLLDPTLIQSALAARLDTLVEVR